MTEETEAIKEMAKADSSSSDKEFLEKLLDYCKFSYNEEKERRETLDKTMRIYLTALGFAIGVVILKLTSIEKISALIQENSGLGQNTQLLFNAFFIVAMILFSMSFIFTLLVVKMWNRERLCDPEYFVTKAASMETINSLLSDIIADYAVAANRNHTVNEKKALFLSRALYLFLASLLVFSLAYMVLILITKGD